jgi:hypothetical protein
MASVQVDSWQLSLRQHGIQPFNRMRQPLVIAAVAGLAIANIQYDLPEARSIHRGEPGESNGVYAGQPPIARVGLHTIARQSQRVSPRIQLGRHPRLRKRALRAIRHADTAAIALFDIDGQLLVIQMPRVARARGHTVLAGRHACPFMDATPCRRLRHTAEGLVEQVT